MIFNCLRHHSGFYCSASSHVRKLVNTLRPSHIGQNVGGVPDFSVSLPPERVQKNVAMLTHVSQKCLWSEYSS